MNWVDPEVAEDWRPKWTNLASSWEDDLHVERKSRGNRRVQSEIAST